MSHMYLPLFKALGLGLGSGSGSLPSGTLKMALLRLDGTVTGTYALTVTGATAASPIVLTTTLGNVSSVGDKVVTLGIGGTLGANGTYRVSAQDATHITLQTLNGTNTTGVGAYTSGGMAVNLSKLQYYSQISGCVVGTPVALTSPTFTAGVLNATSPVVNASVPAGVVSAYIIYLDTGTPSTSPVLFFSDCKQRLVAAATAASSATSIFVPNVEGPLTTGLNPLTWSNGAQANLSGSVAAGADGITLPVTSLANAINAGHTCDVGWTGSSLPITLGSSSTVNVTLDTGAGYVGGIAGFGEI